MEPIFEPGIYANYATEWDIIKHKFKKVVST